MMNTEHIDSFLSEFCPLLDKILIDNNGVKLSNSDRDSKIYLLEYLTRQSSNLNSICCIYQKQLENIRVEHSLGLLLRNSLADTIFLFYLNFPNKLELGIDKHYYQEEVLKLYASQLTKTFSDNKTIDLKTINKFRKYITIGTKGQVVSVLGNSKGNKDICKVLESTKETKKYSAIYEKWEIYSKYEHFGILTNIIQTRNRKLLVSRQLQSISFVLHGIIVAIENIKEFGDEIKIDTEIELNIKKELAVLVECIEAFNK